MKPTKPKTGARREGLRRSLPRPEVSVRAALQRPEVVNCVVVGGVATIVCTLLVMWSLSTPKLTPGQVATENRLVRLNYEVEARDLTAKERSQARERSPRVYAPNSEQFQSVRAALEGLPRAVAGRTSTEGIERSLVERFQLDDGLVSALQGPYAVVDGQPISEQVAEAEQKPLPSSEEWRRWISDFFDDQLVRYPLLNSVEQQIFSTVTPPRVLAPDPANPARTVKIDLGREHQNRAVEIDEAVAALAAGAREPDGTEPSSVRSIRAALAARATAAGVDERLAPVFVAAVLSDLKPTLRFLESETAALAEAAAADVPPVLREHAAGDRIFLRGDVLSEEQVARAHEESRAYLREVPALHRWLFLAGVIGSSGLLVSILLGYLYVFNRTICQRLVRLAALFALIFGLTAAAAAVAIDSPWLLRFAGTGACIVAAIVVTLAYDRQLAMFVSFMHCLITAMVLEQGVPGFLVLYAGCAVTIAQLREVRHRTALLRACAFAALAMGIGTLLVGPLRMPPVSAAIWQVIFNAIWSAGACIATGFFMLGVLPTLERMCDITTGLTLAELRDPKQPLLRQLQQKAPGTYNHSLQIANIAEAAADTIGANGLLVYVGALYHDIGKMNKPDYFVENQAGGVNKHDRLSPAMSLLVIVGHVKDGIELGREYGLPRPIRHFIESHHGTTLVEYFFNAARSRAEAEGAGEMTVDELAYRYPGPKPRTKEAAILMIADAVESATRALAEPTPSRIENLVRTLSRKRLEDGQFNECDLTLRELTRIEESLIKSVCAIYHGRISYAGPVSGDATSDPPTTSGKLVARTG